MIDCHIDDDCQMDKKKTARSLKIPQENSTDSRALVQKNRLGSDARMFLLV